MFTKKYKNVYHHPTSKIGQKIRNLVFKLLL